MSTALDSQTFDVLSFVANTAYPTETVTVYTDSATAHELAKLVKERKALDKRRRDETPLEQEFHALERGEREVELADKLEETALVFTLQGQSPKTVKDMAEELVPEGFDDLSDAEKAEGYQKQNDALLAKCIVKVENAQGGVDTTWTVEKVAALRDFLNAAELFKLTEATSKVNFNVGVFNDAVDAGFSR